MRIQIWDVGHGACAVVTAPNGKRLMIDCGDNPDRSWWPSIEYHGEQVEELVISNYDEDHVSDLVDLRKNARISFICHNTSVSADDLASLKKDGGMGPGIASLQKWMAYHERNPSQAGSPEWGAMRVQFFWNDYPTDFQEENNLSVVTFVDWSGFRIVFPGDLETAGWEELLSHRLFQQALSGTNVFVAPHHGRKSGLSEAAFSCIDPKPQIVVMSDRDKQFDSQETTGWYASRCRGITYRGTTRRVFTTRNDGHMAITVQSGGWSISTERG